VIISEGMALIERIADRIALQRHRDREKEKVRESSPPPLPNEGTPSRSVVGAAGAGAGAGALAVTEPTEALDFLFIDADSKDSSLGLSAPPAAFLTPHALKSLYQGIYLSLPYSLHPSLALLLLFVIDVCLYELVCLLVCPSFVV
jgi:hypothetical protein